MLTQQKSFSISAFVSGLKDLIALFQRMVWFIGLLSALLFPMVITYPHRRKSKFPKNAESVKNRDL